MILLSMDSLFSLSDMQYNSSIEYCGSKPILFFASYAGFVARKGLTFDIFYVLQVLIVVAMGLEFAMVKRALAAPFKDVSSTFSCSVADALVGVCAGTRILVLRASNYGLAEAYATTSFGLFFGEAVVEVLKVGTAAFRAQAPQQKGSEAVEIGDLSIMGGSHASPLLTVVNHEYGGTKRYSRLGALNKKK